MRLRPAHLVILALQIALLASVAFGQTYKVENTGAVPGGTLAQPMQDALETQGVRVENDQGNTVLEMWLRKGMPTSSNPASSDILFGAMTEGEFVGVVHFPAQAADFRGQAIKAGFYTLRYALIPQDGNHMGVNATRDAFVLCPAAADANPSANLSFDDLVKLGRQAAGTPHPAFLVGAPVSGSTFPSVAKDDQGHWNLQVKGDVAFAFTVVGKWEG